MKTDIQVGSKIKVIDKQSPYFRWRGTVSAETLVAERVEGQPKPDVSSFLCTLHLDGKQDKVELKPEQIACIQKKFIDIEHIREEDIDLGNGVVRRSNVGAFEVGDQIQISEKIDGANASIAYNADEGKLEVFSRTNLLDSADGLRGFKAFVELKFKPDEFKAFPDYVIFGEWCVGHKCRYSQSWYNMWRVYDIWDKSKKNYLSQDAVKAFCKEHGIEYIHVLYEGPFESWAHCRQFMDVKSYGGIEQEGIVVKNQTKLDRDDIRYPKYLKIVNDVFKESIVKNEKKPIDPEQVKLDAENMAKMESIVTDVRVKKLVMKCVDEGIVPAELEPKHIGALIKALPKMAFDDIVKEEPEVVKSVGAPAGKICSTLVAKHVKALVLGK